MAGEPVSITEVTRQEGDHVLVSLPLVGFPPGFQLRPGDRVVVEADEKGPVARPLVRERTVKQVRHEANALHADNVTYATQAATVREETGSGDYVVAVVDRGAAQGPEQAVAVWRKPQ
jgi:hypothetical protein